MSKHEKYTRLKRQIGLCLIMGVALFPAAPMAYAATSVVANNQLPGNILSQIGNVNADRNGNTMTITQGRHNAVIKWDKFDVGGNATVNFKGPDAYYNTLNYVSGGSLSQIYGTINANNNGNIYIVNPAGVQIGNSAQINVGSLYVSTNELNDADFTNFINNAGTDTFALGGTRTAAELMSLGNINANKVTFEGDGRIVIDTERIKDVAGDNKLSYDKINIITDEKNLNNLVIGYDGYDESANNGEGSYEGANTDEGIAQVNGNKWTKAKGYMWVEDVKQLQAIDTNLGGNYALRNSIDATGTVSWNDSDADNKNEGFKSIGVSADGKVTETTVNGEKKYGFYGNFDGLDYNIFGLTINRDISNVGLFGVAHDANINNVTLVGGSITGGSVVGSVVGAALGNTHITNATNSASVTGNTDVGGIVGYSGNEIKDSDGGDLTVSNTKAQFTNLINTGSVQSNGEDDGNNGIISNAGGLIGYMYNGTLDGNSYNLGNVSGNGYNVGGLVGHAEQSTIGDGTNLVYNVLDVTGAYNVGGIVGNMEGSRVQNAENSGIITATDHYENEQGYSYHRADGTNSNSQKVETIGLNISNVGGIVGSASHSTIEGVLNTGDVSSSLYDDVNKGYVYYTGANVGGIAGSAVDTNITSATNRENNIRGAANVGGVAGYFANSNKGSYTVTNGINDGGNILATGGRYDGNFVTETIRGTKCQTQSFVIGNMGGVVGYMYGDNVYITASANRGTVHTIEDFTGAPPDNAKAANVGGIVGKIDRSTTKQTNGLGDKYENAAVSNSYNTGDVRGYTGIGGIAGMMYNGEIAGSYNLGTLRTTRQAQEGTSVDPINMGGIVGDTTEETIARALLYDVYNKGKIGDETYTYYGRHVGGIVGRLSGTVEKAYNTGAIYNGYNVVGGIAGWMVAGDITNAFNTGNITVVNKNDSDSEVGGIIGSVDTSAGNVDITNVYNLGTIRSFVGNLKKKKNAIGGILGGTQAYYGAAHTINIKNAYTTGNLYVDEGTVYSIYSKGEKGTVAKENTYYITPAEGLPFTAPVGENENSNKAINFEKKDNIGQYSYADKSLFNIGTKEGIVIENDAWRIYEGSTPILNAFLPNAKDYFDEVVKSGSGLSGAGIESIQYGTAYDPLLTIIKANQTGTQNGLNFNWQDLGINNDAGIAVYGAGLTLDDFRATGGSGYFSGLIYSDGALNINANTTGATHKPAYETGDVSLGSSSQLYGSSVSINADGNIVIYGTVTATGNTNNGAGGNTINDSNSGDITINAGNVDVYGKLTAAAAGESFSIPGINSMAEGWNSGTVDDPYVAMSDIGNRFAYETRASKQNGDISITATGTEKDAEGNSIDGNVNLFFGNQEQGLITAGGSLNVEAQGDVFVDSDLDIGGNMILSGTGADSEVVLDITNIGQVQAKNELAENPDSKVTAAEKLHEFMHHFSDENGDKANIYLNAEKSDDAKITVDMWDGEKFDLGKFDTTDADGTKHDFRTEINSMNVTVNGTKLGDNQVKDYTYIWVSDGEQLNGIQKADEDFLDFNFALKGDINASQVGNYEAIGTGSTDGFTGTFDGRGNRIIGLKVENTNGNAGIFDTIGANGVVKDVNIYSGTFTGTSNAGSVAGVNRGRIEGVVTFGNTVTSKGKAGGIVGVNYGHGEFKENADGASTLTGAGIYDVESTSSVIAGSNSAIAGGLVGMNNGALGNSFSDSAVTVETGNTLGEGVGLGGVVGVNNGNVQYVDSLGITNGGDTGSSDIGGIIGINNGNMYSGYNESIVSGKDNVGGIIGTNAEGKKVENVVNAISVTGKDKNGLSENVGGLIGVNKGNVTNGRNNGTITGTNNVGGLVGNNADENSILTNLVNDSSAEITGIQNVGGIAGNNEGTITTGKADDENEKANLINRGSITGHTNVGGVAGINNGTIENANNDVELNVNPDGTGDAQFFGGIAGVNTGTITNATNTANVNADGATYVGGIVGKNDGHLKDMAGNSGNVTGKDYVGGVAGLNKEDIDGVNASNTGDVISNDGGAGGIFGENSGNIINSELSNNGAVTGNGGDGTGGIFGTNSGDITYSSLKNEIGGQVTGTRNVGGLIGKNTGTITGGRDASDSYYKYQIYNNGVITVTGNGSNIGGLIGNNTTEKGKTGSLTAGYNTGAINAGSSTNVGGIAGTNEGTLDQVFSTIFDADGHDGNVIGGTNVGGLVGNNSGTLSNAYNTSVVTGNSSFGTLVGMNNGTVANAYTTVQGSFFGNNSSGTNVYFADVGNSKWKDHHSYGGFDFDTDGSGIWKNYDGYGNPLLKVFLTKAYYNPSTGQLVSAADGFEAHYNADGGLIFPGGMNNLWSTQIGFSKRNPNWLGYDLIPFVSDENWDFLYDDAPFGPFDRNRDFRERKAEINFVDGGMEL